MNKVKHRGKTKTGWIVLVTTLLGMALFPPWGMGQSLVRPEMNFPKHYPDGFHGVGIISEITAEFVMIDDRYRLPFSPGIQFHRLRVPNSGRNAFSEEDRVGYLLNEQKEVTHLYELPEPP